MAKHRLDESTGQQWGGPELVSDAEPNRHVAADPDATIPLPAVRIDSEPGTWGRSPAPSWAE
jgi:hypothetical protein